MKSMIAILAVALLVACAPAAEPEAVAPDPVPPAPEPELPVEPEPEPEPETEPEPVESGLDKAFGQHNTDEIITVDDVICDKDAGTLEFRFRNKGEKTWQMNQDLPFPSPPGMTSVRVLLNQYEVNNVRGAFKDGVRLFFDEDTRFSDVCGGVEEVAPGEEATCKLENVPFNDESAYGFAINELVINTAGTDGNVRFSCESSNLAGEGFLWSD